MLVDRRSRNLRNSFAEFQGAKYGVCVNSGTSALYIALKAAGVCPGDEVITTPYTFPSDSRRDFDDTRRAGLCRYGSW